MRSLIASFVSATLLLRAFAPSAAELTSPEIKAAKKLYEAKCAKCHRFYEPADYPEKEWRLWMEKMSRKSKLKPDQEKLLNHYLDDYRRNNTTKAAQTQKGKGEK